MLVVDDEADVRVMAEAALRRYGYEVLLANDGRQAVELFERDPGAIDVVLLDMTMPSMDGEETYMHMRHVRPDVRVIASSGYNQIAALRRLTGKGLVGFIQKPYTASQLAAKLKEVLTGAGREI